MAEQFPRPRDGGPIPADETVSHDWLWYAPFATYERPCAVCGDDVRPVRHWVVSTYRTVNGQECGRTHMFHADCYALAVLASESLECLPGCAIPAFTPANVARIEASNEVSRRMRGAS